MRQFVCSENLSPSGTVRITGKNYRYLARVLRLAQGDVIDVRLPDGALCSMKAQRIEKDFLILEKTESLSSMESGVSAHSLETAFDAAQNDHAGTTGQNRLWLFQFLPRQQKMDLIVRQATECGVFAIVPIIGDYSTKGDYERRTDRWDRIVTEARQQSGSSTATKVFEPLTAEKAMELWKTSADAPQKHAFVLHEDPAYSAKTVAEAASSATGEPRDIAMAVGCEGGISPNEMKTLTEAGFKPLHFVTNVLRAETAALYGIAVIQQMFI